MAEKEQASTPVQVMKNIEYQFETLKQYLDLTEDKDVTVIHLNRVKDRAVAATIGSHRNIGILLLDQMAADEAFAEIVVSVALSYMQHSGDLKARFAISAHSLPTPLVDQLLNALKEFINTKKKKDTDQNTL